MAMLDPKSPGAAAAIKKSINLIEDALLNTRAIGTNQRRPNQSNATGSHCNA